ncbi:Calmodulin-binding transcription activator 5 [Vitis vinifera]|uniref:Calmodulin-binding transcription activator 5 n=1 Tax=Vitis vinifera TaxID=29760 RepID=A0A438DX00_VITVI|nr:Calmodulin-binding transcription activator 5 [Vitis vinifera]
MSQGSPVTPVNSSPSPNSATSDPSAPWLLSEETDSGTGSTYRAGEKEHQEPRDSITVRNYEMRIHELNTLEWDELLVSNDPNNSMAPKEGKISSFEQQNQHVITSSNSYNRPHSTNDLPVGISPLGNPAESIAGNESAHFNFLDDVYFQKIGGQVNPNGQRRDSVAVGTGDPVDILLKDSLEPQDSFGRWMNYIMTDSPVSVDDPSLGSPVSSSHDSVVSAAGNHQQSSVPDTIFSITDFSPSWAISTEKTKSALSPYGSLRWNYHLYVIVSKALSSSFGHRVLVKKKAVLVIEFLGLLFIQALFIYAMPSSPEADGILVIGFLHENYADLAKSNLFFVCGDVCVPAEIIQLGVFRCLVPPHAPGLVNFYLSFDGHKPISQVVTFEYRAPLLYNQTVSSEVETNWEEFQFQMRLSHLLFSTSKGLNIMSSKISPNALREAKNFVKKTSFIARNWANLTKTIGDNRILVSQAKDLLFEFALLNKLQEWLVERIVEGGKTSERDGQGQGVIHLCAMLGYTRAVYLYSLSGLSLDYRDKFGWTALHWAAYYGRISLALTGAENGCRAFICRAKPNLVTDPTSENPGGCTAADLASKEGHDGLAAYLAEKGLVEQFNDMTLAGNVSGSLQVSTTEQINSENLSEEEMNLKDTLAAYRTAADAAAQIEARNIVAAMRIQHAFRNYETRKRMAAAARIQHRFRSWKIRKEFLNMRRQAIKIQAVFRGFQVRRQYRKILWSVGVLEKVILRWRMKRKGFRGLQVDTVDQLQESDTEEDFFRASRRQAEDRVERSVIRVQAMFRSKKAQEEYRRMKLAHNEAKLEFEGFIDPDTNMDG